MKSKKTCKFLKAFVLLLFMTGATSALVNLPSKTLPTGGGSFDNAVEIQLGDYSGEMGVALPSEQNIQENTQYFYVTGLKEGQEVTVKGTFTRKTSSESSVTLGLYDENRKELDKNGLAAYATASSIQLVGLGNSEKYYLTVKVDGPTVCSVGISVEDKYDAGTKTDAGGDFDTAMSITPNKITGYLAGGKGADTTDAYRIPAKRGTVFNTEVTPKNNALMKVGIYDLNKQIIAEKTAINPGAKVTSSVGITRDEDVFIIVNCDGECSKEPVEYTLNFPASTDSSEVQSTQEDSSIPSKILSWLFRNLLLIVKIIIGLFILLVIALLIIYFLFFRKKKWEEFKPDYGSGAGSVTDAIVGYKHPCKYCDKLIPPNSNVCPICGKTSPLGPLRCPKCRNPVQKDWQKCSGCGLSLQISCPKCGKNTFFGDYCEQCNEELKITCPNCKAKQPPIGEKCVRCGKKLK